MRGSVSSQMGHVWSQIDGIGVSKAETRAESALQSIDGQRAVSGLVHSLEYKDEIFKTGVQLGNFAREEFGIKNMEKIDGEIVQRFIDQKIEAGVSAGTLNNQISHLAKIETALERIAENAGREYEGFSRADLKEARETIQDRANSTEHINRAYESPGAIISNLERNEYIAGRLQLEHGLRVAEATRINEKQLNGNTLTYEGKGGKEQVKELSSTLASSIRSSMENGRFSVNENHYRESLRESARVEGQKYTGSHGLRYSYAQATYTERYESNREAGMSTKEAHSDALSHTSQEMGHNREEITTYYLR